MVAVVSMVISLTTAAQEPAAVWLYNHSDGVVLVEKNSQAQRPIASITKVMTAMVVLDARPDLDAPIKLVGHIGSYLPRREYTRKDLLNAMLVKSDNAAAESLAADYPGGRGAFIAAMNEKARRIGMRNTSFDDASGLSKKNVSTAADVNAMIVAALKYDFIRDSAGRKQVTVNSNQRLIHLNNTNRSLMFELDNVVMSKTGFTRPAGWCVAMVVERDDETYVVVVLGSTSPISRAQAVKTILADAKQHQPARETTLANWFRAVYQSP